MKLTRKQLEDPATWQYACSIQQMAPACRGLRFTEYLLLLAIYKSQMAAPPMKHINLVDMDVSFCKGSGDQLTYFGYLDGGRITACGKDLIESYELRKYDF